MNTNQNSLEQEVQKLKDKYNLCEEIQAINKSQCTSLNPSQVYRLKNEDYFIIEGKEIIERKNNLSLSNGWIISTPFNSLSTSQSLFNNIRFVDVDIKRSNFSNVCFCNCTFQNVSFKNCKFNAIYFINCTFENSIIHKDQDHIDKVCFYHCMHNDLDIDLSIYSSFIFIESDTLDTQLEFTGAENMPNDAISKIINGEVYQFETIIDAAFNENTVIENAVFTDCHFSLTQNSSNITFKNCQFINLTFSEEPTLFFKKTFLNCEFINIITEHDIVSCNFTKCKFQNFAAKKHFIETTFTDCEMDDPKCFADQMIDSNVFPENDDALHSKDKDTLFKGYKTILLTTMIQMKSIAKKDEDLHEIDKILNRINALGKGQPQKDSIIRELIETIQLLDVKDLKKLMLEIQTIIFENI